MKKTLFSLTLCMCFFAAFTSCSNESECTDCEQSVDTEQASESDFQESAVVEEESPYGNLSQLIGSWSVDAGTAGVQVDLTFGEDGTFTQTTGPIKGVGTWTKIDDEHINIVTQNTNAKGKKWEVRNLTEGSVNLTWNLDSPEPKTLPMSRVK